MFAKIRSLLKQSAVYGVGTIAARAVAFLLLPYYSHLLTPTEYGIYALFLVMVTILQPLYIHGMDIAFLRFSASASEKDQQRDLGTALIQTLIVGGTLSLVLVLFAPEISRLIIRDAGQLEVKITYLCTAVLLMDTLVYHIFTWLRIRQRPVTFSMVKLFNVFINIGLNVLFVGTMRMGVLGAFLAFALTSALVLLVLLAISIRHIRPSWSPARIREWLTFGLPNLPSQLFFVAVEFSDRKWIEHYMGVEQAGLYSAGYRIAMLMNMIAQAFRYAWQPFFLQTADDDDARETFARVLTYYVLFTGWVWIAGTFFLAPLLRLHLPGIGPIIDPEYWVSFSVIPIVMLAHIFNGLEANFMVGVYIKKKTKVIPFVVGFAALINIAGNGLLIPIYGYMASAWLTVASYIIVACGMFFYIRSKYAIPYEWNRVGRVVITIVAGWGITTPFDGWQGLVLKGIVVVVLPLIWFSYVLDDHERKAIKRRIGLS